MHIDKLSWGPQLTLPSPFATHRRPPPPSPVLFARPLRPSSTTSLHHSAVSSTTTANALTYPPILCPPQRQFYRLLEMLLLLQLPPSSGATDSPFAPSAEARKAFRLEVKKRLYVHNKEQLSQVEDEQERKEALHKTYKGVEEGYEGVVKRFRRG